MVSAETRFNETRIMYGTKINIKTFMYNTCIVVMHGKVFKYLLFIIKYLS